MMKRFFAYCAYVLWCLGSPQLAEAQQKEVAKPTKVTFRGLYKFPELDFYTIVAGKKTPIKESSSWQIDPWKSLVVRAEYTRNATIVARCKVMYANIPTEIYLSSITHDTILYVRKAEKWVNADKVLANAPTTPKDTPVPVVVAKASAPKLKPKATIIKETVKPSTVPATPKKAVVTPEKSSVIPTKLVTTSVPEKEEPILAGTLIPRRAEQPIVKANKPKFKPIVAKSATKRGQSITLMPVAVQ